MITEFLGRFLTVLAQMAPWLLLGFAVAGILHVLIPGRFVLKHLSGRGFSSVLKASLLGVPLPLCSCGVIPVAASLRSRGASSGATAGFLISTPQTGVDSVLVTYSLMGPVFAVFRVLAAFISGLLGGALVDVSCHRALSEAEVQAASGTDDEDSPAWARALRHGFVTLPGDLAKSLTVGLLIAAAITVLLPADLLADLPGGRATTMVAMLLLGLPIYVCATASVPIAAALMLSQGVSPGAALVFLMTGPATNAATMVTIRKMMGTRAVVVYLASVMVTALAAGFTLDAVAGGLTLPESVRSGHAGMHGVSVIEVISAVVLALLLLRQPALSLARRLSRSTSDDAATGRLSLTITGMSCRNCAEKVRSKLAADPRVASVQVDLASGSASVALAEGRCCGHCDADAQTAPEASEVGEQLCRIVRQAGYGCDIAPNAGA